MATSPELAERVRHVGNFAIDGRDVTGPGINAKLSSIAAAVGLAALDHLDAHVDVRTTAIEALRSTARPAAGFAPGDVGTPPGQCLPLLLADQHTREAVIRRMRDAGIETRAYYCPGLHETRAWRDVPRVRPILHATDRIAALLLCVPVYSDLLGTDLDHFVDSLAVALGDGGEALAA